MDLASSFIVSIRFFFNDTATTEIYTLSLHDALPICTSCARAMGATPFRPPCRLPRSLRGSTRACRSEEHTSELQSHVNLVCRLLLEKKKKQKSHKSTTQKKRHADPLSEQRWCYHVGR